MVNSYSKEVVKHYSGDNVDTLPMVLSWLKEYSEPFKDFSENQLNLDAGNKYYSREKYNQINKNILLEYLRENIINE